MDTYSLVSTKPKCRKEEGKCAKDIFCQWEEDQKEILSLLEQGKIDTLWNPDGPLCFDSSCHWGMGKIKIKEPEGIRRSHSCLGCRIFDLLVDLEEYQPGDPFIIESGPETGKKVYLEKINLLRPQIKVTSFSMDNFPPALRPKSPRKTMKIESDPLTSDYLNSILLRKSFEKDRLDPIQKVYTAFICRDQGYLLKEKLIPLSQIPENYLENNCLKFDLVAGLILQLGIILQEMKKKGVVFSKCPQLFLSTQPFIYRYQGKVISYPLTLKFGNLGKLSWTYSQSNQDYRLIEKTPYSYPYQNSLSTLPMNNQKIYRLSESNFDLVQYLHRLGFPLFLSLGDYILLLTLLREEKIGQPFLAHPETRVIWNSLWPEDQLQITSELEKIWEDPTVDLCQLLKGKNLYHQCPLL